MKKVGARKALKFFEENYIMLHSLEAKDEEGCADKCLEILKKYVENIDKKLEIKQKSNFTKEIQL